jgi:ubiquinone/menaquinone biosynthesis C-methylase UbiE
MLEAIRRFADRLALKPATFHWLRRLPEANYKQTKRRIADVRDSLGNPKVLDLGCGTAEYAELFDPARYLGVDIHSGYIEFAQQRLPSHRFLVADVRTWAGEDQRFDLVMVNGVLHHLDDAAATEFLNTAKRLTTPNGTLLVIEDVTLERPSLATRLVHLLDYGEHIRDAARWQALVSTVSPIARSETYVSGICPYHLMVCPQSPR